MQSVEWRVQMPEDQRAPTGQVIDAETRIMPGRNSMMQNPFRDVLHDSLVHMAGLKVFGGSALSFTGNEKVV